jgi:hypothetical protein
MTLTEKLLARAAGKAQVQAGDNVWVNVDVLMTHDVCGPGRSACSKNNSARREGVGPRTAWSSFPDHYIFTADSQGPSQRRHPSRVRGSRASLLLRSSLMTRGEGMPIPLQGDADASTALRGRLPHRAARQRPHVRPGEVLLGTDSHTCTAGAFGSSPPASATRTPVSSWARAKSGSRCPRRCSSASKADSALRDGQGHHPALHRPDRRHGATYAPCSSPARGSRAFRWTIG